MANLPIAPEYDILETRILPDGTMEIVALVESIHPKLSEFKVILREVLGEHGGFKRPSRIEVVSVEKIDGSTNIIGFQKAYKVTYRIYPPKRRPILEKLLG